MIPEPRGRRGRCPCCHTLDTRLRPCLGCDWAGASGRVESKERLERLSPGSGHDAYNPTGCRVCAACLHQMSAHPIHCPLRRFHDLAPSSPPTAWDGPLPASPHLPVPGSSPEGAPSPSGTPHPGPDPLASTWALWEQWLSERGWPEITECYWRRLVAFLQSERKQSAE